MSNGAFSLSVVVFTSMWYFIGFPSHCVAASIEMSSTSHSVTALEIDGFVIVKSAHTLSSPVNGARPPYSSRDSLVQQPAPTPNLAFKNSNTWSLSAISCDTGQSNVQTHKRFSRATDGQFMYSCARSVLSESFSALDRSHVVVLRVHSFIDDCTD